MPPGVEILEIPGDSMVLLIGAAGSGKSTFALEHFRPTEILSSDFFRALASDDAACQEATGDAFDLLRLALSQRLRRGKLCVVDATNVSAPHRAHLLDRARHFGRPAVALVLDTPAELCLERAGSRVDRKVPSEIVLQQLADLELGIDAQAEGFVKVCRLKHTGQVQILRTIPSGGDGTTRGVL